MTPQVTYWTLPWLKNVLLLKSWSPQIWPWLTSQQRQLAPWPSSQILLSTIFTISFKKIFHCSFLTYCITLPRLILLLSSPNLRTHDLNSSLSNNFPYTCSTDFQLGSVSSAWSNLNFFPCSPLSILLPFCCWRESQEWQLNATNCLVNVRGFFL